MLAAARSIARSMSSSALVIAGSDARRARSCPWRSPGRRRGSWRAARPRPCGFAAPLDLADGEVALGRVVGSRPSSAAWSGPTLRSAAHRSGRSSERPSLSAVAGSRSASFDCAGGRGPARPAAGAATARNGRTSSKQRMIRLRSQSRSSLIYHRNASPVEGQRADSQTRAPMPATIRYQPNGAKPWRETNGRTPSPPRSRPRR